MRGLAERRYRLLYVSPERLVGEGGDGFLARLATCGVRFIAIDEAHCISQWGHDFRPEYRQLARLRERLPGISVHAYTATATARVRRDIASQLALQNPVELVGSFDRPNLVYRILPRASLKQQLLDVIGRHQGEAGIIYCSSRREVDALAAWLSASGNAGPPLPCRVVGRRARVAPGFVPERACRSDRGDGGVRDGHRPLERALRRARRGHHARSSTISRSRGARAGRARSGVSPHQLAGDFVRWKMMLEQNGELTDAARTLLKADGALCHRRRLPAPAPGHLLRRRLSARRVRRPATRASASSSRCRIRCRSRRKILSCVARVGQRFG
jgi:ATP-dependent DNA helicase RecQ